MNYTGPGPCACILMCRCQTETCQECRFHGHTHPVGDRWTWDHCLLCYCLSNLTVQCAPFCPYAISGCPQVVRNISFRLSVISCLWYYFNIVCQFSFSSLGISWLCTVNIKWKVSGFLLFWASLVPRVSKKMPSHPHTAAADCPQSILLLNRDHRPNERPVCISFMFSHLT